MQAKMKKTLHVAGKAASIVLSLFLILVSFNAGWKFSTTIGVILGSTNFLDKKIFDKIFHTSRLVVNSIGIVAWIIIAAVEATYAQH